MFDFTQGRCCTRLSLYQSHLVALLMTALLALIDSYLRNIERFLYENPRGENAMNNLKTLVQKQFEHLVVDMKRIKKP
jgi:hypothetical protein